MPATSCFTIPGGIPAVEAQAIDRSHRIGQTRTVNAYRLITPGTVEEKICDLQQSKAQTIADVLGEEGFARSLTKADLEYLFRRNRFLGKESRASRNCGEKDERKRVSVSLERERDS